MKVERDSVLFSPFWSAIFCGVVWIAQITLPRPWRIGILLVASFGAYAIVMAPHLVVSMCGVIVVSYYIGLRLHGTSGHAKRTLLSLGIGLIVVMLSVVKYVPVVLGHIRAGFDWSTVGVSYFSLCGISYLADVYLGVSMPEPRLSRYALYIAFFPKLAQGPIERAGDLLPQFDRPCRFCYSDARAGMLRFSWGLFKKLVVADRLGVFVAAVFGDVRVSSDGGLVLGVFLYAFQIYMDFSAYTDMARGAARVLSIQLTENFRAPYASQSVSEFWRRWHISFSQWLQDYVFRPLQLSWRDAGRAGYIGAALLTFLICGLWHGMSWNFVVWGALHGSYVAVGVSTRRWRDRIAKIVHLDGTRLQVLWRCVATFCLVDIAWVFFRTASMTDALYVISRLPRGLLDLGLAAVRALARAGVTGTGLKAFLPESQVYNLENLAIATLGLGAALLVQAVATRADLLSRRAVVRWVAYLSLILAIGFLGVRGSRPFIYFGF